MCGKAYEAVEVRNLRWSLIPGKIPHDPPYTLGDCSDRRLHCEDGAEPGLALHKALICLRSLGQWVRLDYRFNFSLRYEIEG